VATDTHSEYVILIALPLPAMVTPTQINVAFIRTLAVLFEHTKCRISAPKYRKCFSFLHAAAGISKISLVQKL
jgi:hypothetical protein